MATLFALDPEGISEVVNDINGELTNFWHVLADEFHFPEFQRIIQAVPFGQEIWKHNCEARPIGEVDRAVAFFIRYRQSRQGLGKDFSTLVKNRTRRGMQEQVSAWLSSVEGLPEAHERLKRVAILNDDALKVIKQQDGLRTLFYLDPTYLHEDEDGTPIRVTISDYEHEMTLAQHVDLLETLLDVKGRFLLSGYPSKLYERYAKIGGWVRHEKEIDNKASSKKIKDKETECLWCNHSY
jgi:DNA adenine methylase